MIVLNFCLSRFINKNYFWVQFISIVLFKENHKVFKTGFRTLLHDMVNDDDEDDDDDDELFLWYG